MISRQEVVEWLTELSWAFRQKRKMAAVDFADRAIKLLSQPASEREAQLMEEVRNLHEGILGLAQRMDELSRKAANEAEAHTAIGRVGFCNGQAHASKHWAGEARALVVGRGDDAER